MERERKKQRIVRPNCCVPIVFRFHLTAFTLLRHKAILSGVASKAISIAYLSSQFIDNKTNIMGSKVFVFVRIL